MSLWGTDKETGVSTCPDTQKEAHGGTYGGQRPKGIGESMAVAITDQLHRSNAVLLLDVFSLQAFDGSRVAVSRRNSSAFNISSRWDLELVID